jgi:hypothetical protein
MLRKSNLYAILIMCVALVLLPGAAIARGGGGHRGGHGGGHAAHVSRGGHAVHVSRGGHAAHVSSVGHAARVSTVGHAARVSGGGHSGRRYGYRNGHWGYWYGGRFFLLGACNPPGYYSYGVYQYYPGCY